jgi:hypothetical protein
MGPRTLERSDASATTTELGEHETLRDSPLGLGHHDISHRLAAVVSLLLHPALVAIFGLLTAVRYEALSAAQAATVVAGLVLPSILIPIVCQVVMWQRHLVSDFYVTNPDERRRYLLTVAFVALPVLLVATRILPLTENLGRITAMLIGGTVAFAGLSLRVKASLHVAVLTGVVVGLLLVYGERYAWGLALIPVVAWARQVLKQHTLAEVVAGAVVSALIVVVLARI